MLAKGTCLDIRDGRFAVLRVAALEIPLQESVSGLDVRLGNKDLSKWMAYDRINC